MKVFRGIDGIPPGFGPSAVTIGVFDGVHRGHQALMRSVLDKARSFGVAPVVVTFDRHPLEVIAPGRAPALITTLDQRARLMSEIGIQAVVALEFDEAFRALSPDEFVRTVLVEKLSCVHCVVGANFRFGHQQSGNIETLADLGARYGFDVSIFAMQMGGEKEVVSSSLIRRHISEGRVERVAEELDRPFRLEGYVEHGASRGHGLGFPTANLLVHPRLILPRLGVYAGWMHWRDVRYPVVVNVGMNPTFGDRDTPVVEAHVIGFDLDLYGQNVEIEFLHRLRDERKFEHVDELVRQMRADVERARELLRSD
ncbi:MAG: bifunctional riboflavin kinase/FAD synthetase [Actinomycetota bacterium]